MLKKQIINRFYYIKVIYDLDNLFLTVKELLDNWVSIKEIKDNGGKVWLLDIVFEKLSSNAKPKNDLQSNTTNDFKNVNCSNSTPTF